MKVGIISKEEHAKSHVAALLREGHEPIVLGGNPTSVPESLDLLICRVVSCSHGAADLAQRMRREGRLPVVFENGVEGIIEAVRAAEGQHAQEDESMARTPNTSVAAEIQEVVSIVGLFHPRMLALHDRQLVDYLVSQGFIAKNQAPNLTTALRALMRRDYNSIRRYARSYPDEARLRVMYYPHAKSGMPVHEYFILGDVKEEALTRYFKHFGFKYKADLGPHKESKPVVQKPVVTSVASKPVTVPEPVTQPVAVPEPVKEAPTLVVEAPEPAPEPLPAPPKLQKAPSLDDVKAALSLLKEAMLALDFKRIEILQDGSVNFERVVVTTGSFVV